MTKRIQFIIQSITHLKETGTILPCSKSVGKKISQNIQPRVGEMIIELGAGTGAITNEILKKIDPSQDLICFEINKKFCKILERLPDKRIKVINDSAENISKYLKEKSSIIISTLPLTIMKKEKNNILKEVKKQLKPKGKFIQFQYSKRDYKILKSFFNEIKVNFILFNILPGYVFTCSNS